MKLHNFQFNCKLHVILKPLQMESDSFGCSGLEIFLRKETSWKNFAFLCFAVKENFY